MTSVTICLLQFLHTSRLISIYPKQNKLISTSGFFIAVLVTKDDRQCDHLIESPLQTIDKFTKFTLVISNDQLVDMENGLFLTSPVYVPMVLNLAILLFCAIVCIAMQAYFTRQGNHHQENFVERKMFTVISVREFNENFIKKYGERKTPHTYYGKMIIIIAIFFAIPVFELTIYNVTVSLDTIRSGVQQKLAGT